MNEGRIAVGLGLIAFAILPTPDDVTVVSPVAQALAGSLLIVSGMIDKEKK